MLKILLSIFLNLFHFKICFRTSSTFLRFFPCRTLTFVWFLRTFFTICSVSIILRWTLEVLLWLHLWREKPLVMISMWHLNIVWVKLIFKFVCNIWTLIASVSHSTTMIISNKSLTCVVISSPYFYLFIAAAFIHLIFISPWFRNLNINKLGVLMNLWSYIYNYFFVLSSLRCWYFFWQISCDTFITYAIVCSCAIHRHILCFLLLLCYLFFILLFSIRFISLWSWSDIFLWWWWIEWELLISFDFWRKYLIAIWSVVDSSRLCCWSFSFSLLKC